MLKRSLLLVALCVLVLSVALVSGQEVVYPTSGIAALPNVLVFIEPPVNPTTSSQPLRVGNTGRQSVTFMPWTVKGWVSTDIPASVTLGALRSRDYRVTVDWTRMEPMAPLEQAAITRIQSILRAQGVNWTPGHGVQGTVGAIALDPTSHAPITWVVVIAIHSSG